VVEVKQLETAVNGYTYQIEPLLLHLAINGKVYEEKDIDLLAKEIAGAFSKLDEEVGCLQVTLNQKIVGQEGTYQMKMSGNYGERSVPVSPRGVQNIWKYLYGLTQIEDPSGVVKFNDGLDHQQLHFDITLESI